MKIGWLEKYAEDGLIRKEVLASIYNDVEAVIKTAKAQPASGGAMKDMITAVLSAGAGAVGTMAAMLAKEKYDEAKGRQQMMAARASLAADPMFKGEELKAQARFDEIATYAPHVAMNEPLAKKIIKSKLHSGLTDHDAQSLALIQSQYVPDIDRNKNFMPKMAEVRPEVLGNIVADVYLIKEAARKNMVPAGERALEWAKHVGTYASVPLLMGAGVGALNHMLSKVNNKKLEAELEASFRKAVNMSDPDREPLQENKDKARQAFQALAHFAPQVALQPQAARAFMSKIVAYDQGMNISDIKDLSEIQKNLTGKPQVSPFSMGFGMTAKMMNTPNIVQDSLRDATDKHFLGKDID